MSIKSVIVLMVVLVVLGSLSMLITFCAYVLWEKLMKVFRPSRKEQGGGTVVVPASQRPPSTLGLPEPENISSSSPVSGSYRVSSIDPELLKPRRREPLTLYVNRQNLTSWALHKHPGDLTTMDLMSSVTGYDRVIYQDGGVRKVLKGSVYDEDD